MQQNRNMRFSPRNHHRFIRKKKRKDEIEKKKDLPGLPGRLRFRLLEAAVGVGGGGLVPAEAEVVRLDMLS
jgi:hypothetical protein